jgi:hypothetical protein
MLTRTNTVAYFGVASKSQKKSFLTFATSPQEEALTPMANLKMLIRVASETDQVPIQLNVFLRH